jgi:CTD kinase subunit alpha
MAGVRRAQDIDQWRPEEPSIRDRDPERERPREKIVEPRAASPPPRAARDDSRRRTHDTDHRPSSKQTGGRSRERTVSRDRAHRRSRGDSREGYYRPSRRAPSADRVSHSHRHHHHHHHHHHHRDTSPPSKRYRSRSPSPHRDSHKRSKRHRSPSSTRSRSRTRRVESPHRPSRSDRDHTRRPTPDHHKPTLSARRRSPSADSYHRHAPRRDRRRSPTPQRKSRRDESPGRQHRRHRTPSEAPDERGRKHIHSEEKGTSRDRPPRQRRSPSPIHRRSPSPDRKAPRSLPRRERHSPFSARSPHGSTRRRSSRSPPHASRHLREGRELEFDRAARVDKTTSRRGSPHPRAGHNSDIEKDRDDDVNMRGAYYQHGRGGPHYSHSPSYPPSNHHSPSGHSPYNGSRGGWNGPPHPNQGYENLFCSHTRLLTGNRSPTHGFSPNQPPYPNQQYSAGHHQPYYANAQPGPQPSSYRGSFRGNHFSGPDRRMSNTGPGPGFVPVAGGRGRGAPTQFSNLSWTPGTGTRGGRPATEAPRHPTTSTTQSVPDAQTTTETQSTAVDADDNPFRPSKDLRVEDEGAKEENKTPAPTKPVATPTAPKSTFGFSLKPKATSASKVQGQSEEPEGLTKDKESVLDLKAKETVDRGSSQYPPDTRHERDYRDSDRDRIREREYRDRDRRYDKYDYYDRRPAYRDPRERDSRDLRDSRDTGYYRDRDYRDPRDIRDPRDPRDTRTDPRDYRGPRDPRDSRDFRDVRDARDVRDSRDNERRDLQLPRRPDFRPDSRIERREPPPPPPQPKTKIIKKKRIKPKPTLSADFAASDSVYYRKPGNESVVGSGTYGKVFKGVHVYTKDMVALKKIRMEGERDGVSAGQAKIQAPLLTICSSRSRPSEKSSSSSRSTTTILSNCRRSWWKRTTASWFLSTCLTISLVS